MRSGTFITILLVLTTYRMSSQDNDIEMIDQLSEKFFLSLKSNDLSQVKEHFYQADDVDFFLELFKESMDSAEMERTKKELLADIENSLQKWKENFKKLRSHCESIGIDWSKAKYDQCSSEFKQDVYTNRKMAKVKIRFKHAENTEEIEYMIVKMPRGWLFEKKIGWVKKKD